MLRTKLKNIAEISTGITFRSRLENLPNGQLAVIQMKDLGDTNIVQIESLVKTNSPPPKERQYVKQGDLVFRSRGQNLTACLLTKDVEGIIVAAPLIRIRPNQEKVLSEFLWWAINQSESQLYLASQAKGTMIQMVSKEGLENLEIEIPSLERQKKISDLFSLSNKEQMILETIQKKRALVSDAMIKKIAKETING